MSALDALEDGRLYLLICGDPIPMVLYHEFSEKSWDDNALGLKLDPPAAIERKLIGCGKTSKTSTSRVLAQPYSTDAASHTGDLNPIRLSCKGLCNNKENS